MDEHRETGLTGLNDQLVAREPKAGRTVLVQHDAGSRLPASVAAAAGTDRQQSRMQRQETCSRMIGSAIVVAAVRAHDRHRGDVTAR